MKRYWNVGIGPAAVAALLWCAMPNSAANAATPPAAVEDSCDRLVRILLPPEFLVAIGQKAFDAGIDSAVNRNPDLGQVARDSPAAFSQARAESRAELARIITERDSVFFAEADRLLTAHLAAGELRPIMTFYATATGRKVAAIGRRVRRDGGSGETGSYDLLSPTAPPPDATAADLERLRAFAQTPSAKALQAQLPALKALMLHWLGGVLEDSGPHLRDVLAASLDREAKP